MFLYLQNSTIHIIFPKQQYFLLELLWTVSVCNWRRQNLRLVWFANGSNIDIIAKLYIFLRDCILSREPFVFMILAFQQIDLDTKTSTPSSTIWYTSGISLYTLTFFPSRRWQTLLCSNILNYIWIVTVIIRSQMMLPFFTYFLP